MSRRILGEANLYLEVDNHSPAAFKEKHKLRVSTSPIAKEKASGSGPAKRARTPAEFPQLFTPGGCPQDAEAVYEDFGTVYMQEKGAGVPKAKQIRHRTSASEPAPPISFAEGGGSATPLVKRDRRPNEGKLAALKEEEDPFACLNPTAQCAIS